MPRVNRGKAVPLCCSPTTDNSLVFGQGTDVDLHGPSRRQSLGGKLWCLVESVAAEGAGVEADGGGELALEQHRHVFEVLQLRLLRVAQLQTWGAKG